MTKTQQTKQKKRPSAVLAFLLTLVLVLTAGFLAMLLYSVGTGKTDVLAKTEENRENTEEEKTNGSEEENSSAASLLWKTIPAAGEDENTEEPVSRYGAVLADPEYMAANRIYAKETKTDGIVKIGFAGDILFDDEYAVMATLLRKGGSLEQGISETLLEEMRSMDIMMVNNEFPYTNRGTATEGKTYTFRADTDTAAYLTDMGVDIVSLANNHIYDFGEIGLLDTLDTLEEMQMPYVGAGRNLEEASAPVYFIAGDIKIAFVSATQIERLDNPDTKGATESSAGTFRCWNPEKLYEIVAQAKENSDFVIVYIHWGTENVEEPDWAQLQQAPEIAEAGADLIIGAHPHCLQGIQYFGDTPVFYSLGNFWFNSKTVDTGMVEVEISKEGLESVRFVPAVQKNCFTDSASEEDRERILSYMNSISYQVSIDADGLVKPN